MALKNVFGAALALCALFSLAAAFEEAPTFDDIVASRTKADKCWINYQKCCKKMVPFHYPCKKFVSKTCEKTIKKTCVKYECKYVKKCPKYSSHQVVDSPDADVVAALETATHTWKHKCKYEKKCEKKTKDCSKTKKFECGKYKHKTCTGHKKVVKCGKFMTKDH